MTVGGARKNQPTINSWVTTSRLQIFAKSKRFIEIVTLLRISFNLLEFGHYAMDG